MKSLLKNLRHRAHLAKISLMGTLYARNPRKRAEQLFLKDLGRPINWEHPTHFVEKLRWIQFHTDPTLRTRLADKLAAREYVAGKGLSSILIPLHGVWDSPSEIDFSRLPDKVVLKSTHGSGDAVIVTDSAIANTARIVRHFRQVLARPFGWYFAETHYNSITPRLLAEALLPNDAAFSRSIVDYKFYCCNGEPLLCMVCSDRKDIAAHDKACTIYDTAWLHHPEWLADGHKTSSVPIPEPSSLQEMLSICRLLTEGIPFVRLDLYESGGKPYFGEFTFSPDAYHPAILSEKAFGMLSNRLTLPV